MKSINDKYELQSMLSGIIYTLSLIGEYRDPYTASHQKRVASLSVSIAKEMKLCEEKIVGIRISGLLHDIGKMTIPIEILNKPMKISNLEYELIQSHVENGYQLLKIINFPWPIAQIVYQHHERIDGSGYPNGILGEKILPEAKIISVADVVESMSSHRPFRASLGNDKALDEIKNNKNKLYDPEVVNACLKVFEKKDLSFYQEQKGIF